MNGHGGNFSLFPNSRATGLNIITKAIMPRHMKIEQMELWLKCFEKSGHTKARVRAPIPPHKLVLIALQGKRNNRRTAIG